MDYAELPNRLYTSAGVRALDHAVINSFGVPGLKLMRRAAGACVRVLNDRYPQRKQVTVLCGGGNNGGDGYIVAGMLKESGCNVTVYHVADPARLAGDAAEAFRYCKSTEAAISPFTATAAVDADVIVDALLGIGLRGVVRVEYQQAIEWINAQNKPVLSVDVPSGLCADTGVRLGVTVGADVTVTFIGLKQGLFTGDGPDCCGQVVLDELAAPEAAYAGVEPSAQLLALSPLLGRLPRRKRNSHKNNFGHVLVVGGGEGMGGAAAMSAEAALRSGAGLVSVATHAGHVGALLTRRPELMVRPIESGADVAAVLDRATVVVLGPGLGRGEWAQTLFHAVMDHLRQTGKPVVIDADGLHLLARYTDLPKNHVLTPHPGEAAALLQGTPLENRFATVQTLQERYGGVVVLKGAGTLVHDGNTCAVCPYGNPGMATAGSGDVLTGVIAALIAQGLSNEDAARLGVVVHAKAGDQCAGQRGERGLAATDLIDPIRQLLNTSDNAPKH